MSEFKEVLKEIPQLPQRQDALIDQLFDLIRVGNKLGLYDACDLVSRMVNKGQRENND